MGFRKIIPCTILMAALSVIFLTTSCNKDRNKNPGPAGACEVRLFDGDHFTDSHITIKGPGEFPDMSKLPGANKNWDEEADSFKSGKDAEVTFWSEPGFKGDSFSYEAGAQKASMKEPRSMKIRCVADEE